MTRISSFRVALCVTLLTGACTDNPTAVESPNISIRAAKPAPQPPPSGSSITVTGLGTLPHSLDRPGGYAIASALNNGTSRAATRVAGSVPYGMNKEHPFTWTSATGMTPLAVIEPMRGWPNGVSDAGVIVGEINTSSGLRPFIVTAGGPMSYLPVPSGNRGGATGISADGTCISGWVSDGSTGQAVIWRNGVLEILGPGSAADVTDDCLVVAGSYQARAAVWRNISGSWAVDTLPSRGPGARFIGPVVSTEGTDISPSGEYVSGRRSDSASTSAVVWRRTGSGWVAADMPGSTIYAFGVDNRGRAIGHNSAGEPTLWTRSATGTYTSQVLPSLSRDTQGWPAAINELGQIVGRSRNRDGVQPVLWTLPE